MFFYCLWSMTCLMTDDLFYQCRLLSPLFPAKLGNDSSPSEVTRGFSRTNSSRTGVKDSSNSSTGNLKIFCYPHKLVFFTLVLNCFRKLWTFMKISRCGHFAEFWESILWSNECFGLWKVYLSTHLKHKNNVFTMFTCQVHLM